MALVDALGYFKAAFCQGDAAVVIYGDVAAGAEQANGPADAGLGVAHIFADVHRPDGGQLLAQHVDRF